MEYLIGKVIDGYKIESVLGKGGMGVVYKAKDTTLDRDVALKIMDSNLSRDENFLKRFQSEARALAKLQNPHITTIFALRETQVGLFIVMEYVEGGTLSDRIKEHGHLDPHIVLPLFKQILDALQHAHQAGIVHRDIKPGNIMLTGSDVVKVTDFGLAKMQQQVSTVTMTLGTGGTLYYMSPEQVRGLSNVDARGDIYSLGMTLYEALAGTTPFADFTSDFDIRQTIVEGNIPPPDKLNPAIPKGVSKVVMKAIDKNPDKRYQSALEMWQDLEQVKLPVMKSAGEVARPTRTAKRAGASMPMKPILFGVAGLAALVLLYFVFGMGSDTTSISIMTVPSESKVTVNGNPVGTSPQQGLEVPEGMVSIRVEREGYASADTMFRAEAGVNASVILTLMSVGSPGGDLAELTQDSTDSEVPPGEGSPEGGRNSSNPVQQRSPDRNPTRSVAETGTIILAAHPRGVVTIDGDKHETSADSPVRKTLKTGTYKVEFSHPRYGSKTTTITVDAGQTRRANCYFEQYVNIGANPVWGTIVINGRNTGEYTPRDRYALAPGTHRITVTRDGYTTVEGEKSVTVEPTFAEKVHTLVFTLKK